MTPRYPKFRQGEERPNPEPEPEPEPTPEPPPQAVAPAMTMQQAGVWFRQFTHAFRALQGMAEAVETALSAEQRLTQLQRDHADLERAIGSQRTIIAGLDQTAMDARAQLDAVRNDLKAQQDELAAVRRDTAQARIEAGKERDRLESESRRAIAELTLEREAAERELAAARERLATFHRGLLQHAEAP